MITIEPVELPDFGHADAPEPLSSDIYRQRLDHLMRLMKQRGLDVLIVYADREHAANMAYLTGFDPRFEEALLILTPDNPGQLLVGNECMGYLPDTQAIHLEVECFQPLSLMGQPRHTSRPLQDILRQSGVKHETNVGCVGWKYEATGLCGDPRFAIGLPAYLVDILRSLTGNTQRVTNATDLLTHPQHGLRIFHEPPQIARFEFAATTTSAGVLKLLRHLRPGVREMDLEHHLDSLGLPLSCHRMISFGQKAARGLASASAARAAPGQAYTTAFGVEGSLTARAGVIAQGPVDLPHDTSQAYEAFVKNYYETVVAWYEALAVGKRAADVHTAAEAARNDDLLAFALNTGHYIHIDEWTHSPFASDSEVVLQSGMAIQADIIPVSRKGFHCSNVEDGVALADENLRATLTRLYPQMMDRINARRRFMQQSLGITLHESVLPLGNTPAWLPPYVLNTQLALVNRAR